MYTDTPYCALVHFWFLHFYQHPITFYYILFLHLHLMCKYFLFYSSSSILILFVLFTISVKESLSQRISHQCTCAAGVTINILILKVKNEQINELMTSFDLLCYV